MYYTFDGFGEGSQDIRFEVNDWVISSLLPIGTYLGTKAVGDPTLTAFRQTITAGAQAGAEIAAQHDKLTARDYRLMGGYVAATGVVDAAGLLLGEHAPDIYGAVARSGETYVGQSRDIGTYVGTKLDFDLGQTTLGVGAAFAQRGQRADLSLAGENFRLSAGLEHAYPASGRGAGSLGGRLQLTVGF